MYDTSGSVDFLSAYDAFCVSLGKDAFAGQPFLYQSVPSARVCKPGSKSFNFHTDAMYGHGRNVQNFWVPLVDVADTNSIWFVEEPIASDLMQEFEDACLSIASFNEMALRAASPAALEYGEVAHFNAQTLHGTPINSSVVTRLSFDLRIVLEGVDTGLKGDDFFISPRAGHQDHEKARDKAAL